MDPCRLQLQFWGPDAPQFWIVTFCIVAVRFYRLIDNTHSLAPGRTVRPSPFFAVSPFRRFIANSF